MYVHCTVHIVYLTYRSFSSKYGKHVNVLLFTYCTTDLRIQRGAFCLHKAADKGRPRNKIATYCRVIQEQ